MILTYLLAQASEFGGKSLVDCHVPETLMHQLACACNIMGETSTESAWRVRCGGAIVAVW